VYENGSKARGSWRRECGTGDIYHIECLARHPATAKARRAAPPYNSRAAHDGLPVLGCVPMQTETLASEGLIKSTPVGGGTDALRSEAASGRDGPGVKPHLKTAHSRTGRRRIAGGGRMPAA